MSISSNTGSRIGRRGFGTSVSEQIGSNVSTTSSTLVMAGFAYTFTPSHSGKLILLSFTTCGILTAIGQISTRLFFGIGPAPAGGAASVGTGIGSPCSPAFSSTIEQYCVAYGGVISLTRGITYWFDPGFRVVSGVGSTATLANNRIQIMEV